MPDTFAHDPSCIPSSLEPLQRFNLQQTAANGRVVDPLSIFSRETLRLIKCLSFVRARTVAAVVRQFAGELRDRTWLSRRPIFQTVLLWDAFGALFNCARPPAFSTFFTNHVAGVMHRYWNNVFPDDFGERYAGRPTPYLSTMEFAMAVLDRILADAIRYCDRNPNLLVVFASSMGQAAIDRSYSEGVELTLRDFAKLADCLQLDRNNYRQLLAMEPQTAVEITDGEIRRVAIRALKSCKTVSGAPLFDIEEIGNSICISIGLPPKVEIEAGRWMIGDASHSWPEGGITVDYVDPGTAYHVNEGAMAVYGAEIEPDPRRQHVRADQAKDYLMELAQLDVTQNRDGREQERAGWADGR